SKYTLPRLVGLALSGYIGFSAMPLRLAVWLGIAAASTGFLLAVWALGTKLAGIYSPRGWASTIAVMLFVGGVQLLMLGVIGEYLSRVYDEVRQRPLYIVRSQLGVEDRAGSSETAEGASVSQARSGYCQINEATIRKTVRKFGRVALVVSRPPADS